RGVPRPFREREGVSSSITVEGVAKRFPNGVEVFDGLDLVVRADECVCVIGPSGCGKTTLVRAIDGLVPLDRGRVTIGGVEVRQPRQDRLLWIWEARPRTMVFITHSIEEAVALGDRVVVLSARPARVRTVIPVDISRPRTVAGVVAHPSFVELRDRCWALLRDAEAA